MNTNKGQESSLVDNKLEDNRRFLSDEEFKEFKKSINDAYYKAADLVPVFDFENLALTDEQINEFQVEFICHDRFPFNVAVERLGLSISKCFDKNGSYQS